MEGLTMTCPRFRPRWPSIAVATMHTWHPHQIKTLGVPVDKNTPFSCLARCIQTTFLAKSHARARRGAGRVSLQATTSLRGGELTRSSTHRPRLWTRVQSKWYCQGAPGFAAAAPDPRKAWELRRAARSAAWRSECFGKVCSATPKRSAELANSLRKVSLWRRWPLHRHSGMLGGRAESGPAWALRHDDDGSEPTATSGCDLEPSAF